MTPRTSPPSACPSPGDLVARPVFAADGRAVVARACPATDGTQRTLIETVELDRQRVVTSADVGDMSEASFTRSAELSAFAADDDTWAIASWSDVEGPTTATLIGGTDVDDIRRPGFCQFAFTPEELAAPGE